MADPIYARLPAIPIKYDGRQAKDHLIDLQQLSVSLSGYSKIYNSAAHSIFTGNILLPYKRPESRIQFFVAPFREGSFPLDIIPVWLGGNLSLSEVVASLGTELIQKIASMTFSLTGGQKMDPHYEELAKITNKILENQTASQELYLAHSLKTQQSVQDFALRFAEINKSPTIDAVSPIGKSCETISDGNIIIDVPIATAIRESAKPEIGDIQTYLVKMDGITAHNKTCKLYILPNEETEISGTIADPAFDEWPQNIYKESIRNGVLEIVAKPTLKNGEIQKLSIFNAKWHVE